MEFKKLVEHRRSIHHFLPGKKISDIEFQSIIELVRLTPSGYNAQPWEFILIREDKTLEKIQHIAYDQSHVTQAGNIVVALGNTAFGEEEWERICAEWKKFRSLNTEKLDGLKSSLTKIRSLQKNREMVIRNGALACMTFLYATESLGWNTCPMMGFRQLELKKLLHIPSKKIPLMMIALGKADPNKKDQRLPRKSVEEIAYYEKYGDK